MVAQATTTPATLPVMAATGVWLPPESATTTLLGALQDPA